MSLESNNSPSIPPLGPLDSEVSLTRIIINKAKEFLSARRKPHIVPVITPKITDKLLISPVYKEVPFQEEQSLPSVPSLTTELPTIERQQTIIHNPGDTTTVVNGPLDLKRSSFQGPRSPRQIDEDQQSAARYVATTKNAVVVELRNTDLILTS